MVTPPTFPSFSPFLFRKKGEKKEVRTRIFTWGQQLLLSHLAFAPASAFSFSSSRSGRPFLKKTSCWFFSHIEKNKRRGKPTPPRFGTLSSPPLRPGAARESFNRGRGGRFSFLSRHVEKGEKGRKIKLLLCQEEGGEGKENKAPFQQLPFKSPPARVSR